MSLSKKRLFATIVSYAYAKNGGRKAYQRLHTGTRAERGAGLVEGDVAVRTNTTEEEFDPSVTLNLGFVVGALDEEIRGVSIENMNILRTRRETDIIPLRDINVLEKISVHEGVIALGVVHREVDVLVHVEGHHVLEGDLLVLVRLHQSLIHADRRGSSGQSYESSGMRRITQDKRSLGSGVELVDAVDHIVSNVLAEKIVVLLNDKTHS